MKRLTLSALIGLWGAATMAAILRPNLAPDAVPMITAALLGAFAAGLLVAPLFAKALTAWSVLAVLLATSAGAILAGAGYGLLNQGVGFGGGAILGPLFVFGAIAQDPVTLAVWILGAFAVHSTARLLTP